MRGKSTWAITREWTLENRTADVYRKKFNYRDMGVVLGYVENGTSWAWDFARLYDHPIVNDQVGDRAVLVTMDIDTGTAMLFDRTMEGEVLEFDSSYNVWASRETVSAIVSK